MAFRVGGHFAVPVPVPRSLTMAVQAISMMAASPFAAAPPSGNVTTIAPRLSSVPPTPPGDKPTRRDRS
ncbi:hypothetical protein [Arthrobacter bambusae]|uniref:hypothetical protein n=1 Tax=Arthrobacter bambusae TaxID=1338426 RepID=UPI002780333A|nr:hypothetical protein [Arthrobacter bambusae]MDQ0212408.1 hypothetical protein [Arthrobacter bambusae]MDQ0236856.1 hypothetical protein [Arthrobacter bambusae]